MNKTDKNKAKVAAGKAGEEKALKKGGVEEKIQGNGSKKVQAVKKR